MPLQFLKPSHIERHVNGTSIKFFPVSSDVALMLPKVASPIVSAISAIFTGTANDARRVMQDYKNGDEMGSKTEIEPITVDLARYRDGSKKDNIVKLMDAISQPATHRLLGLLVMSSMREVFKRPKDGFTDEQVDGFLKDPDLDVETLSTLVVNSLEASKGVLGPFGKAATVWLKTMKSQLEVLANGLNAALPVTPRLVDPEPSDSDDSPTS